MLQMLNERLKGVISWVIAVLIGFTFALFGLDYYMQSHVSATMATINGQVISKQDFEHQYQRIRQQAEMTPTQEREKLLKNRFLSK